MDIVVNAEALTVLSYIEFLNSAAVIPNIRDKGIAIIAVIAARKKVLNKRGFKRLETDLAVFCCGWLAYVAFRPEKVLPKSPCIADVNQLTYLT